MPTKPAALAALHHRLGISPSYGATRQLKLQREPARLVRIGRNPDGRVIRLTPRAAAAWRRMRSAAAAEGITLLPISGFRSVGRQSRIIREKLAAGRRISDILRFVAAPGYSEHHTGRAIDIGSPDDIELDEHFAKTAAYRWLRRHAREFGFRMTFPRRNPHGIGYEPWHWCWHAVERSQ